MTKESVRCSDIRKALILLYLKLKELQPDSLLTDLYRTAVEITNLCYTHYDIRTPRSILCLYNRTFLHAHQCSVLFSNPKSTTRRRMFGRYFHSITTHAAGLFRIISLRSLNTEQHERMFQQAKALTKGTSNNHPQNVISNIIKRLQFERTGDAILSQESGIKSLSAAVGSMRNTIIPKSLLDTQHYQAHLERISDFLIHGPGVWWKETPDAIMFLDGTDQPDYRDEGPTLQSFRSVSSMDIDLFLQEQWEACCSSGIVLPATRLRYYNQDGTLESISVAHDPSNEELEMEDVHFEAGAPERARSDGNGNRESGNGVHDNLQKGSDCSGEDMHSTVPPSSAVTPGSSCITNNLPRDTGTELSTSTSATGSNSATPSRTRCYKTSLAKTLYSILSDSCELREFDRLRYSLKHTESGSSFCYKSLHKQFEQKIAQQHETSFEKHIVKLCKRLLTHEWGHKM